MYVTYLSTPQSHLIILPLLLESFNGMGMNCGLRLLVSGSSIWALGAHVLPLTFSFWWRLLVVQLVFVGTLFSFGARILCAR